MSDTPQHTEPERQTPRLVAVFRGTVTCRREAGRSPGLTLIGAAAAAPRESLILTLLGPAPDDLPATLAAASVLSLDGQCYRIVSPPREWLVWARAAYVHREVAADFYQAIPPHRVPVWKRLLWRLLLALAAGRAGRRILLAIRRR